MNQANGYKYLEPRTGSRFRQFFVKGKRLSAEALYRETIGEEPRTPEEVAQDFDVPLEAVREAIDYCTHHKDILQRERAEELARLKELRRNRPPLATDNRLRPQNDYPTSDGRPMAETDWHRDLMNDLINTLQTYYAADPMVYVSGNLLLYYVPGNKRRHLSPDVFVVKGVPKHERPNYLVWEEGKGPDVVIELTSSSTRNEDVKKKFGLYQDTFRVAEYFLFDPLGDYLKPPLQGYRLRGGKYAPIRAIRDRLPSKILGLRLERHGAQLRLYDPATKQWLPTPKEKVAQAELAQHTAEAENQRLRRELKDLQRRLGEER